MFDSAGYINTPNIHEVSKTDMVNYKGKLAEILHKHMLTADVLSQDTEMKSYVENYVMTEVINSKTKDSLLGIVKKLAHMEMKNADGATLVFPIIHTYKGHNLTETTYFYKNPDGTGNHGTVSIESSNIIIP